MSGLDLLHTYDSDSENDDVDNDTDQSNEIPKRLPLPGSIASWKGVPHHEEVIDDPLQHDGRIRSFRYERDEISKDMQSWMTSVQEELPIKCNMFPEEFHISLTRTLILKFHWIESFVEEIKKLCEQTSQFSLELLSIKVYTNEETTRTFLGIECFESKGILSRFVQSLNKLLAEYELPPFYQESSYHVSFLWCLGNESTSLNDRLYILNTKLNQFLTAHEEERRINVTKINLKIGNKLYAFKLI